MGLWFGNPKVFLLNMDDSSKWLLMTDIVLWGEIAFERIMKKYKLTAIELITAFLPAAYKFLIYYGISEEAVELCWKVADIKIENLISQHPGIPSHLHPF